MHPHPALRALLGATLLGGVACSTVPIPLPGLAQVRPTPAAAPGVGAATPPAGGRAAPAPTPATVPVTTVAATRGPIRSVLRYSGTVQPVQQTNLSPKTSGRIEHIYANVGDPVRTGQVLIELDRAALNASVAMAQANVASADAKVGQIEAGPRPQQVAAAQAQVDAAEAKLAGMQAGGRPADVGAAQAGVASAQARLDQVQSSIKPADLAAAEQAVRAAQAAFNTSVSSLNKLARPSEPELTQAKVGLQKADAALQQAQAAYDRVSWRPDIAARPESLQLQQATLDRQNAAAALELKSQPRPSDVDAAERQVQSTRAQLDAAQLKLDQLRAGPAPDEIRAAEAGVAQAQQSLLKAQQPNSPTDIEQQRQAVVQAQQNLSLAANPYTPADLDVAKSGLAQARAQLVQAEAAAREGVVVAPYDGVVTSRPLAEGSLVGAGTTAIAVASSDLEVPINVESGRIDQVQVGQPAALTWPTLSGRPVAARVASIAPTADQTTHSFAVKIKPDPTDPRLRAGTFVDVEITTAAHPDAVLVPRVAVVTQAGRSVVFLADNGLARRVDVTGGLTDERYQEAPSGVAPGDQVIVEGQASLQDGDPVRATSPLGPTPTPTAEPGRVATLDRSGGG